MPPATTTDHHNRGLFKKMNLRKSMMRNNKKSSGSGNAGTITSTNPVEPELVSRRVVKATPVPADANINPAVVPSENYNDDQDGMEGSGHGGDIALRSVQDETLREKTEQWRQERLDASAAIRKENKEKEVLEHRHRESSGVVSGSKSSESLNALPVVEVPAVLTVASEFPEHKRKIRTNNHHDGGKKSRVDDGSGGGGGGVSASSGKETARAVVDAEEEKDWKATAVDAIKRSAAPAAIVAVVAIVAMSLFRSKR
mmetsp:Transcript_9292/g.10785  ORF Transcript_9292/g.10785 Transcript_9292/m.10785 type:complete len:256 (+) Transcript_9292:13-780(+)